eukprot:jgi/Botrbrau1/18964/Bobra.0100s0001.1
MHPDYSLLWNKIIHLRKGECLALFWAINKFRIYLDGKKFTVYTDHSALQWLNSKRHENSKLEMWAITLQEFDYEVQFLQGKVIWTKSLVLCVVTRKDMIILSYAMDATVVFTCAV